MNRLGYLLLLLTVVAITVTSSWLLSKVDNKPLGLAETPRHDPDYFMTNFTATLMNEKGLPRYKMSAARLDHYPDDNSIDISKPNVEYYRMNLSPWVLVAEQGQVFNKGNLILLNGKVTMERKKSTAEPYLKLITRDLRIQTDTEYAETDAKVFIQTDNHKLYATGMRLYLAQGKLELRSKVSGEYASQ